MGMLLAYTVAFAVAFWLGLYLSARNSGPAASRYAGIGLLVYALGLALHLLTTGSDTSLLDSILLDPILIRFASSLLFLPALLWAGALIHLLPNESVYSRQIVSFWRLGLPVLFLIFLGIGTGTELIFDANGLIQPLGYWIAGAVALSPLVELLLLAASGLVQGLPRRPFAFLLLGLLFFSLSASLLLLPAAPSLRALLLLGMGIDLLILGGAAAALDAFREGEAWLPELLRSFSGAIFAFVLFTGPILIAIGGGMGPDPTMMILLLVITGLAVGTQAVGRQIDGWLDDVAFAPFPRLQQSQAEIRESEQIQRRLPDTFDPARMGAKEFARLTRRALSHFGNLPRLAESPLTRLPQVDREIASRSLEDSTLERAAVLKEILDESIQRLAPLNHDGTKFEESDEWRFYNALYYPYVMGIRPYSRRANHSRLGEAEEAALTWFREVVPERTLYNWQNAAASLVAADLSERAQSELAGNGTVFRRPGTAP